MLLILDSCEHVIETAAALAERIFEEAPQVHILATSRESLRVEGEHVHAAVPAGSPPMTPVSPRRRRWISRRCSSSSSVRSPAAAALN